MHPTTPLLLPDQPFTLRMAQTLGLTRQRLRLLVAQGAVRRLLRGVYVAANVPDSLPTRARAASLVVSPATVLCDRTAAWLHGVDVMRHAERDLPPPLDTFVFAGHARTRQARTYPGQRALDQTDVMTIHGVRVTTPRRTALDLGCALPRRDALAALDAFLRTFDLSREELLRDVPRYFRRRGVRQLRGLVPLADGRAESPGESWTRLEIVDSNLPLPELQWIVRRDGRELFRLDLAYPGLKICIEYDGEEFHDSASSREADERRRDWLRRRGWIVIVVTKDDFTPERIAVWTEQLRRAIESRRVTVRLRPGRRTSA